VIVGIVREPHPLLDGHLARLPHELGHRDYARHPHAAQQHHEHATHVRQAQFVGGAAALRRVILRKKDAKNPNSIDWRKFCSTALDFI